MTETWEKVITQKEGGGGGGGRGGGGGGGRGEEDIRNRTVNTLN